MNKRIQRLRNQSTAAQPSVSPERALLVTAFYERGIAQKESVPVQRALVFDHILKNKTNNITLQVSSHHFHFSNVYTSK